MIVNGHLKCTALVVNERLAVKEGCVLNDKCVLVYQNELTGLFDKVNRLNQTIPTNGAGISNLASLLSPARSKDMLRKQSAGASRARCL